MMHQVFQVAVMVAAEAGLQRHAVDDIRERKTARRTLSLRAYS